MVPTSAKQRAENLLEEIRPLAQQIEQILAVDAQGVRDAAERARSELRDLQKARLALTAITDGAEKVRATVDGIDAPVRAELDGIDALIARSDAAAD